MASMVRRKPSGSSSAMPSVAPLPAHAQDHPAERKGDNAGNEGRRRQAYPHRPFELDEQQRRHIGAERKKRRVGERQLADVADDEVEAERDDDEYRRYDAQVQQVLVAHKLRQREQRQQHEGGGRRGERMAGFWLDVSHA